ncbi:2'-5' RNA ligase [Oceanotoga teriensis]|jgi:2'-5' RNA ligase|uniref:RNA 2',3'-cyclic phosphodiesterase n=1 Tax=Oceanotoga teriensis TaxID=515440 RepID=A0AA45HJ45_9BACT|nr:RNA 2',3'-cyclic phosphodiesterase [Oceanotoga teriensis]PWJ95400.1 2'-5' RNA ligase [Oceanotoga teriensis]
MMENRNSIRTFIAIESNEEQRNLLTDSILKLDRMGFKSNWTKRENIHLTLFFLGNLNMSLIAKLAYKIGERISGFPTFVYTTRGIGYFSFENEPKSIWFGVEEEQILKGLYSEIKKSLLLLNINVKDEKFVPHITLGRVKKHPEHWDTLIKSISFEPIQIPVNSVGIFSSTLTKTGPVYKKLYSIDFEGGVIING